MALQPLAPLQDLLPKATLGTSGADVIKEVQEQQVLQAQAQAQQQAARASQAQAVQAQAKAQQDQLELQRKQAFQTALASAGRNPSSDAYGEIAGQFPEFAETMKTRLSQLDDREKRAFVSQALPAFNALARGKTGTGVAWLERLARAHENRNQPDRAQEIRSIIDAVQEQGPYAANGALGGMVQAIMGKEGFDAAVTSMGLENAKRKDDATTTSLEAKAAADSDARVGLLAQNAQTLDTGAAQAFASRAAGGASNANALKTGVETTQLQAEGPSKLLKARNEAERSTLETDLLAATAPSTLVKVQEDALTATAARKIKEEEAIVAGGMQREALRKAVADADNEVARATNATQREKALAGKAEAEAGLAKLTLADAPIDNELKREALRSGNLKIIADIADMGVKQGQFRDELDLKRKEADERRRMEWEKQRYTERELDPATRTRISGMVGEANKARDTVRIAENLLLDLERDGSAGKILGKAGEWLKGKASYQGAETALRQNLNRFIMRDVLTQIPPGALSEAEQATIREGVPKAFDSDDVLKRYLNAAIKSARVEADIKDARAQWESLNSGNAAAATRPFNIMGVAVKPQQTFEDFKKNWGRAQEIERKLREGK